LVHLAFGVGVGDRLVGLGLDEHLGDERAVLRVVTQRRAVVPDLGPHEIQELVQRQPSDAGQPGFDAAPPDRLEATLALRPAEQPGYLLVSSFPAAAIKSPMRRPKRSQENPDW